MQQLLTSETCHGEQCFPKGGRGYETGFSPHAPPTRQLGTRCMDSKQRRVCLSLHHPASPTFRIAARAGPSNTRCLPALPDGLRGTVKITIPNTPKCTTIELLKFSQGRQPILTWAAAFAMCHARHFRLGCCLVLRLGAQQCAVHTVVVSSSCWRTGKHISMD